jgi:hypothetical protein
MDPIKNPCPAHGDMAFTVPLFDEFMIPAIPTFKRRA